uniref:Probable ATP-dependent RNA helicase spindle-E n=1 Tax=Glossina brevipalpis TaxID=37001 RepID=A0A1A9W0T4_9MUSC
MQKEISIVVTHFINPHLFWYYEIRDYPELQDVEQRLQICKKIEARDFVLLKCGEKLAVNYMPWNKFIRAETLYEVKTEDEFIVWALDYGFPFRTKKGHVRRLPKEINDRIDRIRCGGVANILPAEIEYNHMEGNLVMVKKDNWSQKACDILEKFIMDAISISFIEEFQSIDNHYWGRLIVGNHKIKTFNVHEPLISNKFALEETKNFKNIILELETIKAPRYFSNNGKLIIKYNDIKDGRTELCKVDGSATTVDEYTRRKVEAWRARNKRQNNSIDSISILESNSSMENLDDVTFDDSVSARCEKIQTSPKTKMNVGIFVQESVTQKCHENDPEVKAKNLKSLTKSRNRLGSPATEKNSFCETSFNLQSLNSTNTDKQYMSKGSNLTTHDEESTSCLKLEFFEEITQKNCKENLPNQYDDFTVVPGGFDFSRLNSYRNEKSHWHRKKTTRFDNSIIKPRTQNQSTKPSPPLIVQKLLKENNFANISSTTSPTTVSTKISKTHSKFGKKRRKLKPPETQFDKIDKILQNAERAKQLGDDNIVDLKYPNTSYKFKELSRNSLLDLQIDSNNLNSSSNSRALLENRAIKNKSKIDSNNNKNLKIVKYNEQQFDSIVYIKKKQIIPAVKGEKQMQAPKLEVLAHSNIPLHPLKAVNEAQFLPQIHKEMLHMGINKIYRIQVFAWSHLLRNNSVFIINPSQSGKTWSYLPALCNDVYYDVNSMKSTYGPVAIVLVASTKHVEEVVGHCQRLLCSLKDEAPGIVASFGLRNFVDTKIKLLNSCGMLVTTPSSLLRLFKDNENESLFDAKRLRRVVIDDIDIILSRAPEDFQTALKTILKMCRKPKAKTLKAQIVVTSRCWDFWFVKLMRLSDQPLLLIGDFLEATIYGRVELSVKLRSKLEKEEVIRNFLKKCNETVDNRTMIICNEDAEVKRMMELLREHGYPTIGYYSCSTEAERLIINEWKHKVSNQILVCTDDGLPELQIQNARHLIHYSMPNSWTQFTTRFAVLVKSYDNVLTDNFRCIQNSKKNRSLILLDEHNNLQLPRLVYFMHMHHQTVHPNIQAVTKRLLNTRETQRICKGVQLCSEVLEFGECEEPRCNKRHEITSLDVVSENDDIPMHGEIRIHILKLFSPTHYTARLLEHKPPHDKQWYEVRRSHEAAVFAVQLNLYYHNMHNRVQHWPPKIGDMCIYRYSNIYRRARIVDVPIAIESVNVIQDSLELALKLIDDGIMITAVRSNEIFHCDEKFKEFPHQAMDIRLMNMIPYDNERVWDSKTTKKVQNWIMDGIKANHVVQCSVNFALASTIWINNLVVMEKLDTIGIYREIIHLKSNLIANKFALPYKGDRKSVRDIASESGLLKLPLSISENSMNCTSTSSRDSTNINEGETSRQVNANFKNNREKRFNSIDEEHGKETTTQDKPENEPETFNKTVSFGKETWSEIPLNKFVKVELGDEGENGNWENMFVQLIDETFARKFDQLIELINKHVENIKTTDNHPKIYDFQRLHNCIIKHNNLYLRAKVHCVFGKEINERLYRFFLCDYACFINVKSENLYEDFFYETTDEIVNFIPYQAIHCNLAGIQWDRFTKRYKVTKEFLYVYAVQENSKTNNTIVNLCKFPINSYMVLLYECEEKDDFTHASLFNKMLLDNSVAVADPDTKHFLNAKIDLEVNKLNEINPQHEIIGRLLECIQKCKELDEADLMECEKQETEIFEGTTETPHKPKSINELPEQVDRKNTSKTASSSQHKRSMPFLKVLYKRPKVTWHQRGYLIFLSIHVPDVKDYYLKVTENQLYFAANIHGDEHVLILNLLGVVKPKLVSHELCGLNVIVHLVKSVHMIWPRLLKDPTKVSWLMYDYDYLDVRETDRINQLSSVTQPAPIDNSDSDNDSEKDLFHTYNPIDKNEDDADPFSKFFS